MDVIEKDAAMLLERGFDITCDTQYWVQEQGQSGNWYIVKVCFALDDAIEAEGQHIEKYYKEWDPELVPYPVRIVMRHVVEVVL